MPPKVKISREDILHTAVKMVREKGIDVLNARDIARELSCSTQPIFFNFSSMAVLREAVLKECHQFYLSYITKGMEEGGNPPYKASGMAYIRFASEERELFKLLFMRDRAEEKNTTDDEAGNEPLYTLIEKEVGISREEARFFHFEMWITVHGIAVMVATNFWVFDNELTSRILSDVYMGLKSRFEREDRET